jgi:hypothetical protein
MVVLFNAFCLPPITQVARKDVGDMKPRQQMRDWRALARQVGTDNGQAAQTKRRNGEGEFRGRSVADNNRPAW